MPIEFRCTQCQKLLRVPDETAGRQAKCPACDTVLTIPSASSAPPLGGGPPTPPISPGVNPYQAPSLAAARADEASLIGTRIFQPTTIEVTEVVRRAWEIYKLKMGFTMLVVILGFGLQYALSFGIGMMNMAVQIAMPGSLAYVVTQVFFNIVSNVFGSWIWFGIIIALLNVARGEPTSVGDVFRGGPYLIRGIIATILMMLIGIAVFAPFTAPGLLLLAVRGPEDGVAMLVLGIGALLALIPWMYIGVSIFQYPFLIVDRNMDAISAISLSWKITSGNRWQLLAVYILAGLVALIGMIACCLPAIFTLPLATLFSVVAYLALTGQPTIESFTRDPSTPPVGAN